MLLELGMFGWVKGSGLLSRMAEKTRSVTENVITTLDPQMKDFIHSGGDVQVSNSVSQSPSLALSYYFSFTFSSSNSISLLLFHSLLLCSFSYSLFLPHVLDRELPWT